MFDNLVQRSPGVGVCSPDPETQMRAESVHMQHVWESFITSCVATGIFWQFSTSANCSENIIWMVKYIFYFVRKVFSEDLSEWNIHEEQLIRLSEFIPHWVVKAELLPVGDLIKMFYQESALSPVANNFFFSLVDCTDEKQASQPLSVIPPTLQSANERFVHPVNEEDILFPPSCSVSDLTEPKDLYLPNFS